MNKYEADLSWDPQVRKEYVMTEANQKLVQGAPNLIFIVWNREALKINTYGRGHRVAKLIADPDNVPHPLPAGEELQTRMLDCLVNVLFVSSSPDSIETLEEWLLVRNKFALQGNVTIYTDVAKTKKLYDLDWNVNDCKVSTLTKMAIADYGTLYTLQLSADINYPVALNPSIVKLILHIHGALALVETAAVIHPNPETLPTTSVVEIDLP